MATRHWLTNWLVSSGQVTGARVCKEDYHRVRHASRACKYQSLFVATYTDFHDTVQNVLGTMPYCDVVFQKKFGTGMGRAVSGAIIALFVSAILYPERVGHLTITTGSSALKKARWQNVGWHLEDCYVKCNSCIVLSIFDIRIFKAVQGKTCPSRPSTINTLH